MRVVGLAGRRLLVPRLFFGGGFVIGMAAALLAPVRADRGAR